eukprot:CAMPEP_0114560272 /NCGR_PEP_ID=MMETSP0114-20121206/11372_1 /TAXON_ID=31324 /ORGANISM="Goniomonas sp, Strain m" /LENGTH=351 /DNA_ID=CAMNT_0001745809 /DNA_START=15 /DNA_END=1067 /DNA_ORIENTATION=+
MSAVLGLVLITIADLLVPLHAAVTNCPTWAAMPAAVSLTAGGTGTLHIVANANASVFVCVPSGATATPATLTGSGMVTLSAGSWLGLGKITVSMTEAACTASRSMTFYVDPISLTNVSVAATCGSGSAVELGPQSPTLASSVHFRMRSTECEAGFGVSSGVCEDINECATANGGCSLLAQCTNTVGSRTCVCNNGTSGTGLSCTGSAILGLGSGTWTPPYSMNVKVLAVGGGGGGGRGRFGGGGSGYVTANLSFPVTAGVGIPYTVGAGGLPEAAAAATSFGSVIANGGGTHSGTNGGAGGSGGGGGGTTGIPGGVGGTNGASGAAVAGESSGGAGSGAFPLGSFSLVAPG